MKKNICLLVEKRSNKFFALRKQGKVSEVILSESTPPFGRGYPCPKDAHVPHVLGEVSCSVQLLVEISNWLIKLCFFQILVDDDIPNSEELNMLHNAMGENFI